MNREERITQLVDSLRNPKRWKPNEILGYACYLEEVRLSKMSELELKEEYELILGENSWPEEPTVFFYCRREEIMNREELEELIDEYLEFYPHRFFPSYEDLEIFYRAKVAAPLDRNDYDNICEDRWERTQGGTINEKGHKSKGDYTR